MMWTRVLATVLAAAVVFLAGGEIVGPSAWAQGARTTTLRNATGQIVRATQDQVRQALQVQLTVSEPPRAAVLHERLSGNGHVAGVVFSDGTLDIWNLDQGVARQQVALPAGLSSHVSVNDAGTLLAAVDAGGAIMVLPVSTQLRVQRATVPSGTVTGIALAALKPRIAAGASDGNLYLLEPDSFQPRRILSVPGTSVLAVDVSADGARVLAAFADGTLVLLTEERGAFSERARWTVPGLRAAVLHDTGAIAGTRDRRILSMVPGRQPTAIDAPVALDRLLGSNDGGFAVIGADGRVAVWRGNTPPRVFTIGDRPVVDAQLLSGSRILLVRRDNGWTEAFDATTGETVFRLVGSRSGWAVIDRDGRYDGSLDALREVGWRSSAGYIDMDRFASTYFEPGLIRRYLEDRREFMTEPVRPITDGAAVAPPPEVQLTVNPDAQSGTGGLRLDVRIRMATGQSLTQVTLFQNGRVLYRSAIRSQESSNVGNAVETHVTATAALQSGRNRFQAVALTDDDLKTSSSVIELDGGKPAQSAERLAIVGVGIDQYASAGLGLHYAAEDARSVTDRFSSSKAYPASAPLKILRVDRDAKRAEILSTLDGLEKLSRDDIAVLFLAGHGVADKGEWWFLPQEARLPMDREQLRSVGITADFLIDRLLRIPPSRVLLIIDTCQSGAVVDSFARFHQRRALKRVADSTGVHIIASTRPDQKALEYPALKHGLFTHVMLFALSPGPDGRLNADRAPKDGSVSVEELRKYIEDYVPAVAAELSAKLPAERGTSAAPNVSQITPVAGRFGRDFKLF